MGYFNPRTPCGVRRVLLRYLIVYNIFQSTHPLRGATGKFAFLRGSVYISIHAPLAGCDARKLGRLPTPDISIHAPLAGCDPCPPACQATRRRFQSTHPLRGATLDKVRRQHLIRISIHAPLAGCDRHRAGGIGILQHFNPRTPCGVRLVCIGVTLFILPFQSTHPLRGATINGDRWKEYGHISIHAPLAGCDPVMRRCEMLRLHFNPRTPCGVRHDRPRGACACYRFQSTHPLRGATLDVAGDHRARVRFQSTHPLRGATLFVRSFSVFLLLFQSTHPLRGATLYAVWHIKLHPHQRADQSKNKL